MSETVFRIFRIFILSAIYASFFISFIILINFTYSLLAVTVNNSMLGDLLALMQLWLPFNLSVMTGWAFTVVTIYLYFRAMLFVTRSVSEFFGH